MKLPNKLFSVSESIIIKFPIILDYMSKTKKVSLNQLFEDTRKDFISTTDWIDTICCLYSLRVVNFDKDTGEVYYAI